MVSCPPHMAPSWVPVYLVCLPHSSAWAAWTVLTLALTLMITLKETPELAVPTVPGVPLVCPWCAPGVPLVLAGLCMAGLGNFRVLFNLTRVH